MTFQKSLVLVAIGLWCQAAVEQGQSTEVTFETSAGAFTIELDPSRAPLTSAHFLEYAKKGHYEGTVFHRVVEGFVAQAGGFTENLEEKPAEATVVNEAGNGLSNLRGTVGMARTNDPHSANSQFYVNLVDNAALDPQPTRWGYAVFGRVVRGMEVIDAIGHVATGPGGRFDRSVPVSPIVITNVKVD